MSTGSIELLRQRQNEKLPRGYHWGLHVGANVTLLASGIIACLKAMGGFSLADYAAAGLCLVAWSLIEYVLHRFVLHGSRFSGTELQRQHAVAHHSYFNHRHMVLEKAVDWNRILLFTSHLSSLLFATVGLAAFVAFIAGARGGLHVLLSGLIYVTLYEGAHAASHLSTFCERRGFRAITGHHRAHHHPALAARANFSIVFPGWDSLFGTRAKELPDA